MIILELENDETDAVGATIHSTMSGVNDAAAPASPAVVPAVVVEHSAEDSAPSVGAAEVKRVTEALETVNPTSTDGPVTEGHPASGATEADTTSSEVPATGGPGATAASDAAATTASPVDDAVTSADAATLAPAAETAPTTTSTKEVSPKKEKEKEKKAGGGLVGEFKNLFRSVSPNKAKVGSFHNLTIVIPRSSSLPPSSLPRPRRPNMRQQRRCVQYFCQQTVFF